MNGCSCERARNSLRRRCCVRLRVGVCAFVLATQSRTLVARLPLRNGAKKTLSCTLDSAGISFIRLCRRRRRRRLAYSPGNSRQNGCLINFRTRASAFLAPARHLYRIAVKTSSLSPSPPTPNYACYHRACVAHTSHTISRPYVEYWRARAREQREITFKL